NRLVAISRFDEISPSIEVSNALVKAGLDSILGVSRTSREDLTKVLVDFPEKVLWDTHQHFRAANLILANQEFAARSRYSSGQISSAIQKINDIEFPNCECPDCLSAVGPLAYLADLLDYALEVLRYEDKKLTLSEMEGLLCQPLSDLPTECSQVSKVEISPRLTAEILLKHFSKDLPDHQNVFSINEDIVNAESEYRLHCYTELLTRLGTSYEEIREARLLDRNIDKDLEKLHRIADKIGIDLYRESPIDGTKRDLIDELFRTPDQVTRPWLERTFGLADIERDPLKYGPVEASGEGYDQLSNWDLKGVRWRQNTDFYGQIYVSINADGSKRKVILYRHPNRKKCVAHGEINSNRGTVKLVTEEDSGLSGSVYLSYSYDACDIALEVIPRIVVWRLQQLRSLWTKQDWPDDLPGPIIDPDVISPDDFLAPVAKNSGDPDKAFDIWIKRRQWVDDRRRELMSLKNGDGTPDLAAIFDYMYQKVNYDGVDVVPWADTTQPADFESLSLKLDRGEDIEATKLRIQTDLNLSVESFTRIIEILKKDNLAKIDTRNEKVVKEEWQEVYSILIQAWKEKVYAAWIVEEEDEGVLLGSAQFCISLREPKDGDWPPPPTQQPLIDPHVVDLDDLPDSIVGKRAVEFWHARLDRLDQINNDLRDKLKAEGFEEMLKLALGHPDPGDPLPHDFDALNDNLKNLVDVEATEEKIVKDLHMSVEDFNLLMKVKIGAEETDSSKKPTDDEWAVVYAILTRTQKKKREFPHWVLEESHPTTGIKYWNALKAKLPRWCASHDTRQDWQRQLKFYSQPPLIDIDVIDEYDLRTPSRGDPAFDLWADRQKIRTDYVEGRHELLEDALREVRDGINTTAVDELISQELSLSSVEELQSLSELRASGKNIKPRLDQLCLELNWFDRLVRLKGIELIEDEVNEIIEILWQVHKRRLFGYWHEEEQKAGLTLSPDYFQERTSNAPHERPSNKILSIQCRLDYEDKLSNRINQDEQVQSAGSDLLKSVDAETIVSLRNAFVLLEQEGSDLEEKAKLLCEKRGVDFRSGPNQTSTRVSLAIEALQGLLFGTRNEIRDSNLKLTVDDD
ncbi:MAG: hypothetical protein KAV87_48675, partial [Desulfobacteraceae bacterium]|nr:hypothetical protein [Desulfobacteraceae bacterium]